MTLKVVALKKYLVLSLLMVVSGLTVFAKLYWALKMQANNISYSSEMILGSTSKVCSSYFVSP